MQTILETPVTFDELNEVIDSIEQAKGQLIGDKGRALWFSVLTSKKISFRELKHAVLSLIEKSPYKIEPYDIIKNVETQRHESYKKEQRALQRQRYEQEQRNHAKAVNSLSKNYPWFLLKNMKNWDIQTHLEHKQKLTQAHTTGDLQQIQQIRNQYKEN